MLKQGIKTINASSSSDLMQGHFYVPFAGHLLSLMLISKTLETSLDLTLLFKTSIDARVEGFVSNVDYLENRCRNFI